MTCYTKINAAVPIKSKTRTRTRSRLIGTWSHCSMHSLHIGLCMACSRATCQKSALPSSDASFTRLKLLSTRKEYNARRSITCSSLNIDFANFLLPFSSPDMFLGVLDSASVYETVLLTVEFKTLALGFVAGIMTTSFIVYLTQRGRRRKSKTLTRQALAELSALEELETLDLLGDIPAWLTFSDVERSGWLNKVVKAAWPYLDAATSSVIVKALDPILRNTRPSFLTSLQFERFSFGSVPAIIEGVKVYESSEEGALEIDLKVFWAGDPDVVLKIRAAQDALAVPVSLTEFECTFTLRLIFAPLIGIFPCFGALTISLTENPDVNFDLRVVGGDITLLPGLAQPLQTYIQALIASFLVWPRCITVPIPGTGYSLPDMERANAGLLHVEVHSHDETLASEAEIAIQLRWPGALSTDMSQEVRVHALPGGRFLNSREITLPVEDMTRQILSVRWYSSPKDQGEARQLTGETSLLLDDIVSQIDFESSGELKDWGPVTIAVELESTNSENASRDAVKRKSSMYGRMIKVGSDLLSRGKRFSKKSTTKVSRGPEDNNVDRWLHVRARIVQLTVRYQSIDSMRAPLSSSQGFRLRENEQNED